MKQVRIPFKEGTVKKRFLIFTYHNKKVGIRPISWPEQCVLCSEPALTHKELEVVMHVKNRTYDLPVGEVPFCANCSRDYDRWKRNPYGYSFLRGIIGLLIGAVIGFGIALFLFSQNQVGGGGGALIVAVAVVIGLLFGIKRKQPARYLKMDFYQAEGDDSSNPIEGVRFEFSNDAYANMFVQFNPHSREHVPSSDLSETKRLP